MPYVLLKGWRPGLRKVSLTNLLRARASLDLETAKTFTDRCLAGEAVRIAMPSLGAAEKLAREMSDLGANADVEAIPQRR
jgi:hypothetical protein